MQVVIYLDREMQYHLIPYKMRPGQQPRDLERAGNTRRWIWIGSSGWFGSLSPAQQRAGRSIQKKAGLGYPYEWTEVELSDDEEAAFLQPRRRPGEEWCPQQGKSLHLEPSSVVKCDHCGALFGVTSGESKRGYAVIPEHRPGQGER